MQFPTSPRNSLPAGGEGTSIPPPTNSNCSPSRFTGRAAGEGVISTRVIGMGNPFRRDDAVGLVVTRRLAAQPIDGVQYVEIQADGTALMRAWAGVQTAILVDAMVSGSEPGHIFRFDAATQSLPAEVVACSTHAFGVGEAVEMARVLGELPPRLILYGIEGACFETGVGLSPEVEHAADEVVNRIRAEITD